MTEKLPVIEKHLRGYRRVANYGEGEIQTILKDFAMIRHEAKVRASVEKRPCCEVDRLEVWIVQDIQRIVWTVLLDR